MAGSAAREWSTHLGFARDPRQYRMATRAPTGFAARWRRRHAGARWHSRSNPRRCRRGGRARALPHRSYRGVQECDSAASGKPPSSCHSLALLRACKQHHPRLRTDISALAREVAGERQDAAVAHAPARVYGRCPEDPDVERTSAAYPRRDLVAAQCNQPPIQRLAPARARGIRLRSRSLKGLSRVRIWQRRGPVHARKVREACKFAPPSFAHGLCQLLLVIREEKKRRWARIFFAHENKRYLRAQKLKRNGGFERAWLHERRQSLAEGAVSDLIMVLQKKHEGGRRQAGAWAAAPPAVTMGGWLALINEALRKAAGKPFDRAVRIIGIVAFVLAGEQDMQDVVAVVIPLRIEIARKVLCRIGIVFQHKVDMPSGFDDGAHFSSHFIEPVRFSDCVSCIQAQPVEPKLGQPVNRILGEEAADLGQTEIDCGTPWCHDVAAKHARGVQG